MLNRLFQIAIAFLICTGGAWGSSFTITSAPTADIDCAGMSDVNDLRNFGASATIFVDSNTAGGQNRGFWLRFNGLDDSLPDDAICDSAYITMHRFSDATSAGDTLKIVMARCLVSPTEGNNDDVNSDEADDELNWAYYQYSEQAWTVTGGRGSGSDRAATPDDTLWIIGDGLNDGINHRYDCLPASIDSMRTAGGNLGWIFYPSFGNSTSDYYQYRSDDDGTATNRPEIAVFYHQPAASSSTLIIGPPR